MQCRHTADLVMVYFANCFFVFLLSCVVIAINGLYVALGSPTLPGWTGNGRDPCGELWQGVTCTGSSIIGMYGKFTAFPLTL
jgi:hypothetical protein